MKNEVAAGEEHENGNHDLNVRTVVIGDAVVFCRKSAGGDRAERVADRIEEMHAAEPEENRFHEGQREINHEKNLGCACDPRSQLIVMRLDSGNFRVEERLPAHAQHRQNCKRKDNDSHTADPVGQRAPEKNAAGEAFDSVRKR